mgnify:CR=1 FL=1|jgi:hypothetical protein
MSESEKPKVEPVQQELPFDEDGPLPIAKGAYQDVPGEEEEQA